jgi:hypothetical protein
MATTTFEPRSGGAHARQSRAAAWNARRDRVGLASAVRSEFTKLRSVRSTYWSLLVMIIVCVGMGVLSARARHPRSPVPQTPRSVPPR